MTSSLLMCIVDANIDFAHPGGLNRQHSFFPSTAREEEPMYLLRGELRERWNRGKREWKLGDGGRGDGGTEGGTY